MLKFKVFVGHQVLGTVEAETAALAFDKAGTAFPFNLKSEMSLQCLNPPAIAPSLHPSQARRREENENLELAISLHRGTSIRR
jgi:hypothetical protein